MNYIKEKCAACGEEFTESDDIVVCPDCGSPHHRSCYTQAGQCANADRHGGFTWTPEKRINRPEIIPTAGDIRFRTATVADIGIPPTENIMGISADQAAAFVSSNVIYYLPRFMSLKSGGRGGFNILCLLYPAGFFASRKMWFWAVAAVLVDLITAIPSLVTSLTGLGGDDSVLTAEVTNFVYNNRHILDAMSDASMAIYGTACLIFAMTANRLYLNFTVRSVKRLKKVHGRRLTRTILRRSGGISTLNIILISMILLMALFLLMGATIITLEQMVK